MKLSRSKSLSLPNEFGINPIRGYRQWARKGGHLISPWTGMIWSLTHPADAMCPHGCIETPSQDKCGNYGNGCGIYAWHRTETMLRQPTGLMSIGSGCKPPDYWGVVEAIGRIVWHDFGWRASNVRIVALANSHSLSQYVADVYQVPCLEPDILLKQYPPQVNWRYTQ